MSSLGQFFLCFLVFSLNVFFSPRDNFIFAKIFDRDESSVNDPSTFLESIKPIKDAARFKLPLPTPENLVTKPIRAAIEATSKFSCYKPFTIFTTLVETCLVNQTAQSLDGKILNAATVATTTGGPLGHDVYELHEFLYYWKNTLCNATHNLEARVSYVNVKYKSYEEALNHADGLVVVNIPISTNGDIPNPKFFRFSEILNNKIKGPGDFSKVHCGFTYTWYVNFPYGSIYHSYEAKFVDKQFGKPYTATVVDLPFDPRFNYISNKQFKETFGQIKGVSGEPMNGDLLHDIPITSKQRHAGVCIVNLPA